MSNIINFDKFDLRPQFFEGVDLYKFCKNTGVKERTVSECIVGTGNPRATSDLFIQIKKLKKLSFPQFKKQFEDHKKNVLHVKNTHVSLGRIFNSFVVGHPRLESLLSDFPSVLIGGVKLYDVTSDEFLSLGLKLKTKNSPTAKPATKKQTVTTTITDDTLYEALHKKVYVSEYAKKKKQSYQNIAEKLNRGTLEGGRGDGGRSVLVPNSDLSPYRKTGKTWTFTVTEVNLAVTIINFILILYWTFTR